MLLAWRNLTGNKVILLGSTAAIAFAVLVMFTELGFLSGLHDSHCALLRSFRADLVMASRSLHIMNIHETFAESRLFQAAAIPGVKGAYPVYLEDIESYLRNPETGSGNALRLVGVNVADPVFRAGQIADSIPRLATPMTILFDGRSRSFFGPMRTGTRTELAGRAITVAGTFDLGVDYYYDGNALTSTETFLTVFPNRRRDRVFLGLIHLEKSASEKTVLHQLHEAMGSDIEVMTKAQFIAREQEKLRQTTPAGYIFSLGVAVGFMIGVFICYQILHTDIADRLPQLATLKALGYGDGDLARLVVSQALLLAMTGFLSALLAAFALFSILGSLTGIITQMTPGRVAFVLLLTLAMSLTAGLLAARKAMAADPAELF